MELIHIKHPIKARFYKEFAKPCVIALGFFDGVHLGHKHLIQTAKNIAMKKGLPLYVMTFFPHPQQVFTGKAMTYITPLSDKAKIMQALGVDRVIIVEFDSLFASLSPDMFVEHYLHKLHCNHAVAGFDFHYGCKGAGTIHTLKEQKFEVTEITPFTMKGEKVSSTFIRKLMDAGEWEQVSELLGREHETSATVLSTWKSRTGPHYSQLEINEEYRRIPDGFYELEIKAKDRSWICSCYSMLESNGPVLVEGYGFTFLKNESVRILWKRKISSVMPEDHLQQITLMKAK